MTKKRKKPPETYRAILTLGLYDLDGKLVYRGQGNFMAVNCFPVRFHEKYAVELAKMAYKQIQNEHKVLA